MSLFQSSYNTNAVIVWKLGQPLDEFLGPDLFLYVLKFAHPKDVASAASVSKKWKAYCTNELLCKSS